MSSGERSMYKVAYVMGTSHCGSTMLAFLLNSHPEIVSVGEASPSLKRNHDRHLLPCSCGSPLGECSFWTEVYRRVSEQGVEFTPLNWAMIYCSNKLIRDVLYVNRANPVVESIRRILLPFHTPHIRKKNYANLVSIKTILEMTNSTVFADASKSPNRFELLNTIPELDVRLIWLIRDPRAFVNSMRRRGLSLEDAAIRWKKTQIVMQRAYNKISDKKKMILKYEELCTAPQDKMNSVFRFLEVPEIELPENYKSTPHHIIGHKTRLDEQTKIYLNEKWKKNLTEEEKNKTMEIVGRLATDLGYDA
ncbi:MAG: sulfotransferase [Calditrichaeota bacterium]|nr:MAG: sulfotransferase [Calditrichota bacterium]